jgi:hypothetical protein
MIHEPRDKGRAHGNESNSQPHHSGIPEITGNAKVRAETDEPGKHNVVDQQVEKENRQ